MGLIPRLRGAIGWQIRPPGTRVLWGDSWLGVSYALDMTDAGRTRLTRSFRANAGGILGRLTAPLIARRARRERDVEITNVKRILEARAGTTPG